MKSKRVFLRIMICLLCGLVGAYIGNVSGYVASYLLFSEAQISGIFEIRFIASVEHMLTFVLFAMLVYSPGVVFVWWLRRPEFLVGISAPLICFGYFAFVLFLNSFNVLYGSLGGVISYILTIASAALACTTLLAFWPASRSHNGR